MHLDPRDTKWLLEEKYAGLQNPHIEEDLARLAQGEPVAYVIGYQPFLGLKIYLDSHPLIPRPETEWWTEKLLEEAETIFSATGCPNDSGPEGAKKMSPRMLDLCAGSGAIGCAVLKTLPHMEVFFGELDPMHEQTIVKNVRENNLDESRAYIKIGDLFEPFGDMRFDIIATNPPYVADDRELEPSVTNYEPALALRGGMDGLDIIGRIATELSKHLAENGQAWIECSSSHAKEACALFVEQGLRAEIRTDQYQVPRFLVVSFL
jgi:release factor glutamine methyltransferase